MPKSPPIFTIGYEDVNLATRAAELASRFNLQIDNHILPRLSLTTDRLVLLTEQFVPLYADFTAKTLQKRRDSGKKQGLVRACKPKKQMQILDLTAGWGRDAAVLASFGAEVTMIERHPMVAALLFDALCYKEANLILSLIHQEASDYLTALQPMHYPDIIYLDPMHPARSKSALVKKEMQVLQQLLGPDEGVLGLIELAIQRCKQHVVVKWPQHQTALLKPHASISGKTVRFDIYKVAG